MTKLVSRIALAVAAFGLASPVLAVTGASTTAQVPAAHATKARHHRAHAKVAAADEKKAAPKAEEKKVEKKAEHKKVEKKVEQKAPAAATPAAPATPAPATPAPAKAAPAPAAPSGK